VQNNFGFYIGRYEAGIDPATNNARTKYTDSNQTEYRENGTSPMVVKRDCYPYNYVAWGKSMDDYATTPIKFNDDSMEYSETAKDQGSGAVLLSKNLINSQTTGATSTLCYGVQWEAMLKFIDYGEHDIDNSTEWGNYYDNQIDIDRETARFTSSPETDAEWTLISETDEGIYPKTNTESILLTTGASDEFEAKNIYDVAGNVCEWTMQYHGLGFRVVRGSCYAYSDDPLSYCASYWSAGDYGWCVFPIQIGFRPALYITNPTSST